MQLAFGLAGAAVGWAIPVVGISMGWSIGSAVGSLLGGGSRDTELPAVFGPRLTDLKVQTSTYGSMIPLIFGTVRVAGNLIWAPPVTEHVTTTTVSQGGGGKGGGGGGTTQTQTTYSYTGDFAVAVGKGPIVGIRKAWGNGKLIYDVGDDSDPMSCLASTTAMTVYVGDETQIADPTIEAVVGVGLTPGYRGTAYVVFNDLALEAFGNNIPNLEFEVVKAGSFTGLQSVPHYTLPAGKVFASSEQFFKINSFGEVWASMKNDAGTLFRRTWLISMETKSPVLQFDTTFSWLPLGVSNSDGALWAAELNGGGSAAKVHRMTRQGLDQFVNIAASVSFIDSYEDNLGNLWLTYNTGTTFSAWRLSSINFAANTSVEAAAGFGVIGATTFFSGGGQLCKGANKVPGRMYYNSVSNSGVFGVGYYDTATLTFTQVITSASLISTALIGTDGSIYVQSGVAGQGDQVLKYTADGTLLDSVSLSGINTSAFGMLTQLTLGDDGSLWVEFNQASPFAVVKKFFRIASGTMTVQAEGTKAATDFGMLSPGTFLSSAIVLKQTAGVMDTLAILEPFKRLSSTPADLGNDVVGPLCEMGGLTASDYQISSLVGTSVRGYVISNRGTVRSMIEPLMIAFTFDAVESDDKLKFVTRGGSVAVTIPEADLAAHGGEVGVFGDLLKITRQQEIELPLEINVAHLDKAADYQIGQQPSRRLITRAKQVVTLRLPIVMTPSEAKQTADKYMYSLWTGRAKYEWSTSRKYAKYEPTDVVGVVRGGVTHVIRIEQKDEGANGVINWKGTADFAAAYTQTSVGVPATYVPAAIPSIGPTDWAPLDLPLLRNVDDVPGFYSAACGTAPGWRGTQLLESRDAGITYAALFNVQAGASSLGRTITVLASFPNTDTNQTFDENSTFDVVMPSGITLASATNLQLANGANAAANGGEVLQYRTAVLIATNTYRLSGLLRGQQGSESFMSGHVVGERFVLLDGNVRSVMQGLTDRNVSLLYKPVSVGQTLEQTPAQSFTNTDRRLIPLAPWHLGGGRNSGGDWLFQWTPRTRYEAPWVDNSDAPMGEVTEEYEVRVYSFDGVTLKRTFNVSAVTSATYTSADQTTDFGAPTTTLSYEVRQVSDEVGTGYPSRKRALTG